MKTVGYTITIDHERDNTFYIQVFAPNGTYVYDGYYEEPGAKIEDAFKEALYGSKLRSRNILNVA